MDLTTKRSAGKGPISPTQFDNRLIRIGIAGHSSLNIDGTVLALQGEPGLEVAAVYRTDEEFIAALEHGVDLDVITCSLLLWSETTVLLSPRAKARIPPIVTIGGDTSTDLRAAVAAGVTGYVPMSRHFGDLVMALRAAANGYQCFPRWLEDPTAMGVQETSEALLAASRRPLTRRELDVARLIAEGLSDKEIANSLSLNVRTVQGMVSSLLTKLEVDSRLKVALILWTGHSSAMDQGSYT